MNLTKEQALGVLDRENDATQIIEDELVDNDRWSIHHRLIFKWEDGLYYQTYYCVGATEMQDEGPWDYDEEVECSQVRKVEKIVEVWEIVE